MVSFPVIDDVKVEHFGLYPGTNGDGLHANLRSDLNVVVGANGLGKSTLLLIIFRALTGPYDIPGALRDGDLGSARLDVKRLRPREVKSFADRVTDGAAKAMAQVRFSLGATSFLVARSLRDLSLQSWSVDGVTQPLNEDDLQARIARECGVWSFSDWILILRYVTFYMDDRQVLFWDRSAQKQLLRSLFLSNSDAEKWVGLERQVLEQDSRFRNFRNVYNNESARITRLIVPDTDAHADLRSMLDKLLQEDELDMRRQEEALAELASAHEARANRNLERLQALQRLDELTREYEHVKLTALTAQFPTTADSSLYIWNQILADSECLLCGNDVPALRVAIEGRIENRHCAVCDSPLEREDVEHEPIELSRERSARAWAQLEQQRSLLGAFEQEYEASKEAVQHVLEEVAQLDVRRTVNEQRIGTLRAQLPADADGYFKDRSHLSSMKSRSNAMSQELAVLAARFEEFIAEKTSSILSSADSIKQRFDHYSELFLLGRGELSWSPREDQIGQSSYRVKFPAYELQLSKNDTGAASIRSGIDDVSESQKEFIDLAFRMALIETAGAEHGASLVIDTPESSLDRVFSDRAASVLSDFAATADNRLVVASNLTDGRLIPKLVGATVGKSATWNITNLLDIARPTPAIEELGDEYRDAYERLMYDIESAS
ncbi:AAA family ATPase [Sanguibacter sp. HDW7]|uniref:AAA family ATPase n=1 Tax=Sanguibacter sp. HDW7 TaxID=2714931 RepID=UPI00140E4FB3|nr:AAA family ATPase [Sanguibacter sp. HDW7]QIK82329.1 AAA family ATPase [Sanguibacter sp. HDW7]